MKGDKARQATQFKKNQTGPNRRFIANLDTPGTDAEPTPSTSSGSTGWKRLSSDMYSMVTKTGFDGECVTVPDCDGNTGTAKILRPKSSTGGPDLKKMKKEDELKGMRLVDNEEMLKMMNDVYRYHTKEAKDCTNPDFTIAKQTKWGLCWKYTLMCKTCNLQSTEYKLYKEIKTNLPGSNPAAPNYSLAVGLQDMPIGNTKARLLIASMNVPPPAIQSMQTTSNKISKATTELNQRDMTAKIQQVKEINLERGVEDPSQLNIAMDVRYNSIQIASRRKPGQNASQAIGLAVETTSDKKYIIGAAIQNKLCWKGQWLRNKGYDVTCPDGHEDCTSNLAKPVPLSEYEMGKTLAEQFLLEEIHIKYVTTDSDGRGAAGLHDVFTDANPDWSVERLADPTHVAQGQFRKCQSAKFSEEMFSFRRTKAGQREAQLDLSKDVKSRCSMIYKKMMQEYAGNMTEIKKKLPKVMEATLRCYTGDCSMCRRHAIVCEGGDRKNWWNRSFHLATSKINQLNMTDKDKSLMLEILKMRLSEEAFMDMKLNTNTQKNEAVNRSLSVSLPKNVNFSRNLVGRVASTIHRINNTTGKSTIEKCTNVGVDLSPLAKQSLMQMGKVEIYKRQYNKMPEVKNRRIKQLGRDINAHKRYKESGGIDTDYKKGQLDHNYSK